MMIFGILQVAGLRLMSGIFGAWIDPAARLTVAAVVIAGLGLTVLACWPSGGGVERAVIQAAAQREQIEADHVAAEQRDNAVIAASDEQMRIARDAANKIAASDPIVWRADDSWLRGRTAGR